MRIAPGDLRGLRVSRDVLLALLLAGSAFLPGTGIFAPILGSDLRDRDPGPLSVLLVLAMTVPLVLRRTRPALTLAVVIVAWGAYQTLGYPPSSAALSIYLALYSAGAHLTRHRAEVALGAAGLYVVTAFAVHRSDYHERPIDYVTFVPVLALCWLIGEGVRARARSEAARRAATEREAVAVERARIARELHDVVTHHVTAMVVQAEALPYLLPNSPDRVLDGLGTISTTGRSAMTDLRELLDVLHDPGTPLEPDAQRAPAREPLEALIERARSAGQSVSFSQPGTPGPLPTGLGLALQRVVQESLTNALKHAPGRDTAVTVTHTPEIVEVEIVTSGAAAVPRRPWARSGRGIKGMRDRVAAFGGDLTAGGDADGGFTVRARLPRKQF